MKRLFLNLLLISAPVVGFAQLKVDGSGKASIALSNPVSAANLSTSYNSGYNYVSHGYSFGVHTDHRSDALYNIGLSGRAVGQSNNTQISIGVQGIASGITGGRLYGVVGCLGTSTLNGAGVFGSVDSPLGVTIY